jgi:L-aspartate oxidase
VPAAHYCCGGIRATVEGVTSLGGLLAVGEVACTGLHGANRLASNSLLEGLVFSRRIVRALEGERERVRAHRLSATVSDAFEGTDPRVVRARLQEAMSLSVAVTRSAGSLGAARTLVAGLASSSFGASPYALETRNLLLNAALISDGALIREESRGTHFRSDHPQRDDERWRVHLVARRGEPTRQEGVPAHEYVPPAAGGV